MMMKNRLPLDKSQNIGGNFLFTIGLPIVLVSIVAFCYFSISDRQVKAQTEPSISSENYGKSSKDFEPIRQLLVEANLPFDPELVLNHELNAVSKDLVSSKLSLMPEMQESRRLNSKIKGIQMANIIYLPEKVKLTGTTAIIANQIVFEGTNPVIKGNYPILFYPVETEGALGTTIEVAMREQEPMFLKTNYSESARLNNFVPHLLTEGWTLTIDTSGSGYKEWLQRKELEKKIFSKVSYDSVNAKDYDLLESLIQDTSGGEGAPGQPVPAGMPGGNGGPSPGVGGPPGSCNNENTVNGFPANEAGPGLTGNDPPPVGNPGGRGGNASPQNVYINSPSSQALFFYARGGTGGPGGPGGKGGMGGRGADGGRGGPGANCICRRGGAGNGGMGGPGGKGGKGGDGKKGGTGGDGGDGALIVVSVPQNNPQVTADGSGGYGGRGGDPGEPGAPGLPGFPGQGGSAAPLPYLCGDSPITSDGQEGLPNTDLGPGSYGEIGESRENQRGDSVQSQVERRPPTGGGTTSACYYNYGSSFSCLPGYTGGWGPTGTGTGNYCCQYASPILLDIDGDGFAMTSYYAGVSFDVNGDGIANQTSWTAADTDDAWLVLDRNGNNRIDSGLEMFGDASEQPITPSPRNGFSSLAVFDSLSRGGNADGKITRQDAVFNNLRLWQDRNHNGVSETGELSSLATLNVNKIHLDFRESRRTDEHGNRFKFRAKVLDAQDAQVGRWAWDVFLVISPPGTNIYCQLMFEN